MKTMKSELMRLQKSYIEAKAEHETIKQIEEEVKIQVLQDNEFYTVDYEESNEPKERVLKTNWDFLINDEDFEVYCKLCHEGYLQRGLNIPDWNMTPDFESRQELKKAEDDLLKIGIDIIVSRGDAKRADLEKLTQHWKYRDEMLELTFKLKL